MEAPEKIYVKITHPISDKYTEIIAFEHGDGIEYIRTDAFIEKVCDFIKANIDHYIGHYLNDDDTYLDESFIEDFKKYMEE